MNKKHKVWLRLENTSELRKSKSVHGNLRYEVCKPQNTFKKEFTQTECMKFVSLKIPSRKNLLKSVSWVIVYEQATSFSVQ